MALIPANGGGGVSGGVIAGEPITITGISRASAGFQRKDVTTQIGSVPHMDGKTFIGFALTANSITNFPMQLIATVISGTFYAFLLHYVVSASSGSTDTAVAVPLFK